MSSTDTMAAPSGLHSLQEWMQAVITHPGGLLHGVAAAGSVTGMAIESGGGIEDVIAPSATLSGADRLAIYYRSYHARLLQCLQTMFPALLHALGEKLFNHFALDYLHHHPPRGYTLDRLADAFPAHLAATRPDADAPPGQRERWPDFIIELATLELAFIQVFDGPGAEGLPLPVPLDLHMIPDDDLYGVRLAPVPCLRLFTCSYPVDRYLLAVRRGETPVMPEPADTAVALCRREYRVMVRHLTMPQHRFLSGLAAGDTVGDALGSVDAEEPGPALSPGICRGWLAEWLARGFFQHLLLPS